MDPKGRRTVREGIVAGLLGYGIVALYYGLLNVFLGRSFFRTARELGLRVVGEGWLTDGAALSYAPVLAYNAVHGLAFLAVGMAAAWLVFQAERHPRFWFFFFLVGVSGLVITELFFLLLAVPISQVLSWESVAGANALAALGMGGYLYWRHRGFRDRVEEVGAEAM